MGHYKRIIAKIFKIALKPNFSPQLTLCLCYYFIKHLAFYNIELYLLLEVRTRKIILTKNYYCSK